MLIMEDVGTRSVRHLWQRRCEVEVGLRYDVGCVGGELEGEAEEVVVCERVEDRRRKGMLGRRYSGNGVGGGALENGIAVGFLDCESGGAKCPVMEAHSVG